MRRPPNRLTGAVAIGVLAAIAGWVVVGRRDARQLDADPERHLITDPAFGEDRAVSGGGGVPLHVEVAGDGRPPTIVLVHGWGMSSRFWQYQLRDLRGDRRVVVYDQRGHGASGRPLDDDYSLEALAADLEAVLASEVPPGQRALLVGHSLGAMSVLAWAHRHLDEVPERLAGAILMNTSVEPATGAFLAGRTATGRVREAVARWLLTTRMPVPGWTTPISRRVVDAVALGPDASPTLVDLTEQLFRDCPPDVRAGCGTTLAGVDLAAAATHLDVPCVVVTGAHDRLVSPRLTREVADRLPDARLVELPDAGHQTPLERPGAVTALIRDVADRPGITPRDRALPGRPPRSHA